MLWTFSNIYWIRKEMNDSDQEHYHEYILRKLKEERNGTR